MVFPPDSKLVAFASDDKTIRFRARSGSETGSRSSVKISLYSITRLPARLLSVQLSYIYGAAGSREKATDFRIAVHRRLLVALPPLLVEFDLRVGVRQAAGARRNPEIEAVVQREWQMAVKDVNAVLENVRSAQERKT